MTLCSDLTKFKEIISELFYCLTDICLFLMCLFNFDLTIFFFLQKSIAALESQEIDIGGIVEETREISDKNSLNHSTFIQVELRAINSAFIVLLAIIVCLVDCQEMTVPPKKKIRS
jgi:hypothetical protein